MKSKVIQLSTSLIGRGTPIMIALCQDGSIWTKAIIPDEVKKLTDGEWHQLENEKSDKKAK